MSVFRLRKFVVTLVVMVLALAGFIISVRAAAAVSEGDLDLRLHYAESPNAGTLTEYTAIIGNIGTEALTDLPVTFTFGQGTWHASLLDEDQPCELYRLVAGGEPEFVKKENCFSGGGAILTDNEIWEGNSSPSMTGALNSLPPQHHYRIRLQAHLPYKKSETMHSLSVGPGSGLESATKQSFRQFIANSSTPPTSRVDVVVTPPSPPTALRVGAPDDENGASADYAEYTISWENKGRQDLWQFRPQVQSQLAFDDSDGGSRIPGRDRLEAFGQEYLTEVQCDEQNSSSGLCENLQVSPNNFRSYYSAINHQISGSGPYQVQSTILPVLAKGEKLVLKFRVKLFASCIGPEGRSYALTVKNGASTYSNSPQPRIVGVGAEEDVVEKVASFAAKPCPETTLNLSMRDLTANTSSASPGQAVTRVEFVAENTGTQPIPLASLESGLDPRFSLMLNESGYNAPNQRHLLTRENPGAITAEQEVNCIDDEDNTVCPPLEWPLRLSGALEGLRDPISVHNFRKRQVSVPPGKKIKLQATTTYTFSECLKVPNREESQPVDLLFRPKVEVRAPFANNGTVVYLQSENSSTGFRRIFDRRQDVLLTPGTTVRGAWACGEKKPKIEITVTADNDLPLYAGGLHSGFASDPEGYVTGGYKRFHVTVKNVGNKELKFNTGNDYDSAFYWNIPYSSSSEWDYRRIGSDGTVKTGSSTGAVTQIPLFIDEGVVTIPAYDPTDPDASTLRFDYEIGSRSSQESSQCPSSKGSVFLKAHTEATNPYDLPTFPGLDITYNGQIRAEDGYSVPYVCHDTSVLMTAPANDSAPGASHSTTTTIQSHNGQSDAISYEIRYPKGSIVFPKEALGRDLFAATLPPEVQGVARCFFKKGSCQDKITGLLTLERDYYSLKGVLSGLAGDNKADIVVSAKMGVISPVQSEGFRAFSIITSKGDIKGNPNQSNLEFGIRNQHYEFSDVRWNILGKLLDFGWKNTVEIPVTAAVDVGPLVFNGRLVCENSGHAVPALPAMTVPAGQNPRMTTVTKVGRQWWKDECTLIATSPSPPEGMMWKEDIPTLPGHAFYYGGERSQRSVYEATEQTEHTYAFNWKLVPAPQTISALKGHRKIDPCGPSNAYWVIPPSTAEVTWTKNQDGSIDAVANPGYAFATSVPNQYRTAQHFDAPVDSNRACPSIQLKAKGDRLKGSTHQFTIAWNQTNPATPASTASASSNIPAGQTTIGILTSPVRTMNEAEGTVTLTTSPADALSAYQPILECRYKEGSSPEITFVATDKGMANNRKTWTLKVPDTDAVVTCEATIVGGLTNVTLRSFDGGYPDTALGVGTSAPMSGNEEWKIFPESATPGSFDVATGKVAAFDQKSGKYVFSGMRPGIYYIGRTVTPQGFDPDRLHVEEVSGVSKVVAEGKDYIKVTVSASNLAEVTTYAIRQLGSLTFDKISAVDGSLLEGSAWMLTSTEGGNGDGDWAQGVPLTDCVANEAAACTGLDKQPEAGKFHIDALKWGNYELRETQAPVGFRLPENGANGKDFTVQADALTHSFTGGDAITNDHSGVPNIPHTGGLGRDHLLISGMLVLLIAGVATVLLLRTAQQRP
ncbi:MSCRAMM family protein [Schaalia canis]|uniref:SpaA-like prealbumin fold domain-containing protein n=1 Tax=Schaalia canis TaxID=100469 RepID=A0A3P1SCA0_9ACTO|nr:SpaA isopeptide-forming pilin-related protein [Schaalia canis]RRC94520.1 hypothetical protein EII11_09885 [Schaalia canis]